MHRYLSAITLSLLSISITVNAQSTKPSNFAEFKKDYQTKHEIFKSGYLARYDAYKKKIKEQWGVAELSSKTEYVNYNESLKTKVVTDFENDTIEINIQDADTLSQKELDAVLQKAVVNSLSQPAEKIASTQTDLIVEKAPSHNKTSTSKKHKNTTVLAQLGLPSDKALKKVIKNIKEIPAKQQQKIVVKRTKQRLDKQIQQLESISANQGITTKISKRAKTMIASFKEEKKHVAKDAEALIRKNIKTYKISLKRDRFEKARHYLEFVNNNAKKWQVAPDIILAIMETESHFNPLAKSYVPAYGLMQIVPATAGKDVNVKILGKQNKPSPELLYSSGENVKYGSAYFHILMTRYLKEVEDPTSRLYCAIAAYNTGIGNIAKAFNQGKRGRLKAIKKINALTPDEVYNIIKKRTHTETQRYLDKVLASKQYFSQQKV